MGLFLCGFDFVFRFVFGIAVAVFATPAART